MQSSPTRDEMSELMEVEPGEIVEKSVPEQDADIVSLYVGEDARHSFSDEENPSQLSVPLDDIHRDPSSTETETKHSKTRRSPFRDTYSNNRIRFRSEDRKKFFYNHPVRRRNDRRPWKFSRYASSDRFRQAPRFRNWRRDPRERYSSFRRRRSPPLRKPRFLCHPIVFCSTDEGYTLTNGTRWHTSEFVSPGASWIDDVLDAIRYLTDNACCQSSDSENGQALIVYVPDDLSWRRMNEVISQCKTYWTCTISLRKVKECGNTRWLPHHRDMAERVLRDLT